MHVNADMLQRTREVRDLHERLGHPSNDVLKVMLDHSTSPDIRVTSWDVDNAERWLGPCTACLERKMIAREQARVWGGPDATAVGDMVCLDLIQGDEISLGGNTQLLIGRDVFSGYGFAVGLKNKQTETIMTACLSIKIMLESYGQRLGMLLFDSEPAFKFIRKKSIFGDVRVEYTPPDLH